MNKKIGKALVVGAGISGIRAALDLAETGYGVTLIERAPHIGGILSQLDYQFPTNHCGMCKMLPLVERDASAQFCLRKGLFHENIDIFLNTEIVAIEGEPGNYAVSLREKPTWVDPALCVGCGACEDVCPVDVPDAFNEKLSTHKAIFLPVPHNIPNTYVIDAAACTLCGECEKICPSNAVELTADRRHAFRILVVDDELIVRDSLKEWLADERFDVDTAQSGPEALEKLAQATFHLMLTDIKMPGMDGVELLKKAKEVAPEICVLMMTAYATVETAVDAMKIGALEYLIKPFDPETMIPKVVEVYTNLEAGKDRKLTVGSIVLCGGTDYYNPADEKNVYGYGINPNVITSLEFERILSGTGPSGGKLVRPDDGKAVERIAWLQCVGSRDIQCNADFCSSICCMYAIKEAMLAKDRGGDRLDATIFYMDMRTFGKSFQRYRDHAEREGGVRFERARVHSVVPDAQSNDPVIRYVHTDGKVIDETFDLVILAVGQRPSAGAAQLAELAGIQLNPWGFTQSESFFPAGTGRQGVVVGGSFSGLKDISESVVHASAASLEASRVIHAAGGSLAVEDSSEPEFRDVSTENPRILVAICTCGNKFSEHLDSDRLAKDLEKDPYIDQVVTIDQACTATGWEKLAEIAEASAPNRILIGACLPYLYVRKLKELGRQIHLDPGLMDVVDIMKEAQSSTLKSQRSAGDALSAFSRQRSLLTMGVSRLKHIEPPSALIIPITRRGLVVGGGIAGMHAALAIADHGYPVDLIEQTDTLGGNLHWLNRIIDGEPTRPLMTETVQKVESHPNIDVHLETKVVNAFGQVGNFYTTIEDSEETTTTVEHGVVILATGGSEAKTESYGYGTHSGIITQKELEIRLTRDESDEYDPGRLNAVVMIQCVDSREEPRNYCSRVCCPTSLKHALTLKEKNPEIAIYVLYRDMMTHGFIESYFTKARQAGIIFIQYDVKNKPQVFVPEESDGPISVTTVDPLLGKPVEIETDLLVLATGIVPGLPVEVATAYGAGRDMDGFFAEAESKWRPVDAIKEGVFACGLTLSPRSIPEAIATAGAAAQRSLRILSHDKLTTGKNVATVRHSLCCLCERCIETCPYTARTLDPNGEKVLVNPAMCQGCGDCATVCPNSASVVSGFADKQLFDVIESAL